MKDMKHVNKTKSIDFYDDDSEGSLCTFVPFLNEIQCYPTHTSKELRILLAAPKSRYTTLRHNLDLLLSSLTIRFFPAIKVSGALGGV